MNLKLKSAAAVALAGAATILSGGIASATVVHTEILDRVLDVGGVVIDLNGNGSRDFRFSFTDISRNGQACEVVPYPANAVATMRPGSQMTLGLLPSEPVSHMLSWTTDPTYMLRVDGPRLAMGDWAAVGDEKFVGLRLALTDGTHFGWARVRNMGGVNNFIVRDWAYESRADIPIVTPPLGDVSIDGTVNVDDLLAVINAWGRCSPKGCSADLNADTNVNIDDLLIVINNWSQ